MTVHSDDDWPDQNEYDPRWEVQPELEHEDDAGGNTHLEFIVAVVIVVFVALIAWQVMSAPPEL